MVRFTVQRVVQSIVVFIGVTAIVYAAVFVLPGDPIKALSPQRPLSPAVEAQLRDHYHLNAPLWSQYLAYLGHLLRGDLGTDFYGRSVFGLMAERWPVTLGLASIAWLVELVGGIGLGVWAALRRGRLTDHVILLLGITIVSIPAFVLAFTGQLLIAVNTGLFPVAGVQQGWPMSYLLPGLLLGLFGVAAISRLVRSSVLENLGAGYVRTAYAKGLPAYRVVVHHVLRNSLIATVTYLALDFGMLLAGTIVIEGIFNLPGIGQLLFSGIQQQNGPLVVGVTSTLVLVFLVINLAVDLLYGVLDPRIRYERS